MGIGVLTATRMMIRVGRVGMHRLQVDALVGKVVYGVDHLVDPAATENPEAVPARAGEARLTRAVDSGHVDDGAYVELAGEAGFCVSWVEFTRPADGAVAGEDKDSVRPHTYRPNSVPAFVAACCGYGASVGKEPVYLHGG